MAELNTTLGAEQITCKAEASTSFTIGLRGVVDSTGAFALAGLAEPGQITAATPTEAAGGYFLGNSINKGIAIPAVASENVVPGNIAYSAAAGETSTTVTSAVRIGIWRTTTAAGAIGSIIPD